MTGWFSLKSLSLLKAFTPPLFTAVSLAVYLKQDTDNLNQLFYKSLYKQYIDFAR